MRTWDKDVATRGVFVKPKHFCCYPPSMGTAWTCTKKGLTLTAHLPQAGDKTLRCRLELAEGASDTPVMVGLGMISKKHKAFPIPEPWMCEMEAPPLRVVLKPGPYGGAELELPIPPWITPFKGEWLEIAVNVLARTQDGTTIRLVLEGMQPPRDIQYRLVGLPAEHSLNPPLSPWFFGFFLTATLLLIFLGFWNSNPDFHKAAVGAGIVAFSLAWIAIPRARRWRRLGGLRMRAERAGEGAEARLRVSGRGDKVTGEGRARLVAREFVYSESSLSKFDPIASVEVPLRPSVSGGFQAELPYPAREMAPPSLVLSRAQTRHGILWEVEFELESKRGGTGKAELPLSVAAEA